MRNIDYLNGISGVIPGGVATLNMKVARRYHALKVFLKALIEGDPVGAAGVYDTETTDPTKIISLAKLLVNGVAVRELEPIDVLRIAAINYGGVLPSGVLPFFFSEPRRRTITGEEVTAWDMFGQNNFALELHFKSNIQNPTARTMASYDFGRTTAKNKEGKDVGMLQIVTQRYLTQSVPGGDMDFTTLPKRNPISRLHIAPSAGTVNDVEVVRDGEKVFEASKAENDQFLADYGMVTPYEYSVVFDHEQQRSSPLLVQRDLNLRANFSESNSAKIVVEAISPVYA